MKNYLATVGLLAALSGTVVMAAKIQTQRDPTFDFSRLATWSWNPTGAGDVKVIRDGRAAERARRHEVRADAGQHAAVAPELDAIT